MDRVPTADMHACKCGWRWSAPYSTITSGLLSYAWACRVRVHHQQQGNAPCLITSDSRYLTSTDRSSSIPPPWRRCLLPLSWKSLQSKPEKMHTWALASMESHSSGSAQGRNQARVSTWRLLLPPGTGSMPFTRRPLLQAAETTGRREYARTIIRITTGLLWSIRTETTLRPYPTSLREPEPHRSHRGLPNGSHACSQEQETVRLPAASAVEFQPDS